MLCKWVEDTPVGGNGVILAVFGVECFEMFQGIIGVITFTKLFEHLKEEKINTSGPNVPHLVHVTAGNYSSSQFVP